MGFFQRFLSYGFSSKSSALLRRIAVPLLLVVAFTAPAFGASPAIETDPAVTECQAQECEEPYEISVGMGKSQWICSHEDCGNGTRCRIKIARKGEPGAVETTNPDKRFIKCACVSENDTDGPVLGESLLPMPREG